MNEQLNDIFYYSLTIRDILSHLLVALICGVAISILYRITYRGLSFSTNFTNTIIMLTMVTSTVIMVIGDNLATAFGLVGAMSIIRFRTAVKDTQDIMFIFFALSIGLACGVGLFSVAIVGTIIISLVFLLIVNVNIAAPRKRDFLLQLMVNASENNPPAMQQILEKYCKTSKLVNIKAIGEEDNDVLEISYYVKLKSEEKSQDLIKEVKLSAGIRHANLFFDEE
jgi:uncharacterized membrane protein YhiD involved in acid resistance